MTKTLDQLKAEFAARGGAVTVAPEGVAYGVDKETDKARRQVAREAWAHATGENAAERRAENVREAYHTGGRAAAIKALND